MAPVVDTNDLHRSINVTEGLQTIWKTVTSPPQWAWCTRRGRRTGQWSCRWACVRSSGRSIWPRSPAAAWWCTPAGHEHELKAPPRHFTLRERGIGSWHVRVCHSLPALSPTCTRTAGWAASCICPASEACLAGWGQQGICRSCPGSRLLHCGCLWREKTITVNKYSGPGG